ncbi:YqaE/Pmp3 family membrane protein [Pseudomonas sp. MD330_11]|uniref:YqaE/Pmp3 family membrane protein n=1 Tax=Pseudomonas sp. MD330_11 TaxID=3241255 RepID=UPI0036D339A2
MDFISIIISILLPPFGVFMQVGLGGAFWLNILLTMFCFIPGFVLAVNIIDKRCGFFLSR